MVHSGYVAEDEHRKTLAGISTAELAQALATRPDLAEVCVRSDGMLDSVFWPLRPALGAIACVDGVAVRFNGKKLAVEGGIIRRKTGKFPNKLALVGGVVGKNESIENALRRHFKTDLGLDIDFPLDWDHPVCMRQYAPQVDGINRYQFCWDPGKHSYASTHAVVVTSDPKKIALGSTDYGGQEAGGVEWYRPDNCPDESEWSYNMRGTFLEVLAAAMKNKSRLFDGTF
jgi:ADP-ribose pyrophosphatase YjhB (NUDIX family)